MSSTTSGKRRQPAQSHSAATAQPNTDDDDDALPSTSKRMRHDKSQLSTHSKLNCSLALSNRRCGKILHMRLINFMCHSNLSVEFNTRVNFLVGQNGSGKSAIMAALVLGMGAKAKDSKRAASVSKLIKSGESAARVEITILNEGADAFEPSVYGNSITIVRNITHSASAYAIKSDSGKIISKKTDDLHRILMYHNIQVDNPVFVLNQDSAREFLKEIEPSKNYQLFLKATQIEMILEKLNDSLFLRKDMLINLKFHETRLEKTKKEIQLLKTKLDKTMSVEKMKDNLRSMEVELLWLRVTEHERELDEFVTQMQEVEAKKLKLQESFKDKELMTHDLTEQISKLEEDLTVKTAKYKKQNALGMDLRSQEGEKSRRCTEINSNIDCFKKRLSYIDHQIQQLKNNIAERLATNTGNLAEIRQRNEEQLNVLRQEHGDNVAIVASARRDLKIFIDSKFQRENQLAEAKLKLSSFNGNIEILKSSIARMKSSAKDKLVIFGSHVTQFIKEIEKCHAQGKFSELPRGPLGRYVEVPNEKCRNVVEHQLGGVLHAFFVNNTADRHVLDAILKDKFPNYTPTIITGKFIKKVYDVSHGRVPTTDDTHLLMDLIKCPDPVVMNCLIDRCQIETILVTNSKAVGEHLTSELRNVPQNLQKVVCDIPNVPCLEYYPEPNYRMYSMKLRPARFLQVNVQDHIDQLEMRKNTSERDKETLIYDISVLCTELKDSVRLMDDKRLLVEQHESKIRELQEKIEELENFDYPDSNVIDVLEKELTENENKRQQTLEKMNSKNEEIDEAKKDLTHIQGLLKDNKSSMAIITEEINTIKKNLDSEKWKFRNLDSNFQMKEQQLNEINANLNDMENRKSAILRSLEAAKEKAESKGARIKTRRTEDVILEHIQKLTKTVKMNETQNEDPIKLQEQIAISEHTLETETSVYHNIEKSIDMLKKSLLIRFDFIKKLKQHMALMLQYVFTQILKLRNFDGSIDVNHHEQKLTMSIIPRDRHLQGAVSSAKSLSGGERSFTTVAFLISLWSCVDHPFYFLDEYDVFTDEVNRDLITELLLKEAKRRPHRQYTFLTPQNMSLTSNDLIKIHKLAQPERN